MKKEKEKERSSCHTRPECRCSCFAAVAQPRVVVTFLGDTSPLTFASRRAGRARSSIRARKRLAVRSSKRSNLHAVAYLPAAGTYLSRWTFFIRRDDRELPFSTRIARFPQITESGKLFSSI